jgi:hypothetical protein
MSWRDNLPVYLCLVVGAMLVLGAMNRENFQPEFLDQGNVKETQATANSSYKQKTNAVEPNKQFAAPPIQGMISPFRVNMYDSYIP